MKRMALRYLVPAALLALGCCGGQPGRSPSQPDGEVVQDASAPGNPDGVAAADAAVDAGPNPFVIDLSPWGTMEKSSLSNAGHIVTYSDYRGTYEKAHDIYYYDLRELAEHQVTDRDGYQVGPYVYGDEIIFQDHQFYDLDAENFQVDLYHFDISTGVETRLTNSAVPKDHVLFNRDYVLYSSNDGCSELGYYKLVLMDRHTREETVLAECDEGAETESISEYYAAWSGRIYPGSPKKVHVHELGSGLTFVVNSEAPGWQFFPETDADHMVWQDERDGQREIFLYTFSTGEEVCLTPGGYEQGCPTLRRGIVAWRDYRFSQEWGEFGQNDIYVYELATGAGRRVTREHGFWFLGYVDSGWIAYGRIISYREVKLYAHDLVGDGILTSDGHVIP